ncbi:hypothetical protein EYF80_035050 [Liparis tanakae]|uniref:Uncharacterized protein n=1 Tax=Liparis tanakae TaxID=230148 RepID=A0A4Z2GMI1_9TELE|nr:hypothetical protein EYF80_035050 [Liparis tanakae]
MTFSPQALLFSTLSRQSDPPPSLTPHPASPPPSQSPTQPVPHPVTQTSQYVEWLKGVNQASRVTWYQDAPLNFDLLMSALSLSQEEDGETPNTASVTLIQPAYVRADKDTATQSQTTPPRFSSVSVSPSPTETEQHHFMNRKRPCLKPAKRSTSAGRLHGPAESCMPTHV